MKLFQKDQNMLAACLDYSMPGFSDLVRMSLANVGIRALLPLYLFTCLTGEAHALSCAPPKLNETIITSSVAVFEGVAGNKRDLTWQQKGSVEKDKLTGKFAGVESLSVNDFRVSKNWKGVTTGRTVSVLFNTYWGDNYVPGSRFLIVSPQKIGDMYWTPLCGNSIDLEWARKNGDIRLLEEVIGIGQ